MQKGVNSPFWTPQCVRVWRVDYLRSQLDSCWEEGKERAESPMPCWFHSLSSSETSSPYKSPNALSSSCTGNKSLLDPVLWEEWLRSGVLGLVSWGWGLQEQELPELLALQHPSKTKFCHSHWKIISCKHILCIMWKEHPCIAEDFHRVPLYYFMPGSRLCRIGHMIRP